MGKYGVKGQQRYAILLLLLSLAGCFRFENTPPPSNTARGRPFRFMVHSAPTSTAASRTARFVDRAASAGLRYAWSVPGRRPLNILQTIGNGCAFLDFNNDGNLDILLVGQPLALYQGDGKGRFTDVSDAVGLRGLSGHFLGCAVGDVDGDGYDDLYISGYRTGLLLHNEENARGENGSSSRVFRDVTRAAGLKPQPWGTSCAFFEAVAGSGRLDLYVANYVDFGPDTQPQLCMDRGVETACEPQTYAPLKGVLYRNDGNGRFVDATQSSGAGEIAGKSLGVAVADFDGCGSPGIALANDEMPGDLLRPARQPPNLPYRNVAIEAGVAYDRDGNQHAGMGIDWGDYNNDGRFDLFVTTFCYEPRSLYHNEGKGCFSDRGIQSEIARASMPYVAFGCKFFDYDNDGWLDLMVTNGHVQDNIAQIDSSLTYRQPTQLFHNKGGRYPIYDNASLGSPDLMRPIVGRGLAVGDYDNDGRVDALVVDSEGKPLLLHNECPKTGHWLGVRLIGTKSNRNGYGAVLTAQIGGRTLVRQCQTAGSYLSASDPRVHFGLGKAARVDRLTVRWPGGRVDVWKNLAADRYITIREGNSK